MANNENNVDVPEDVKRLLGPNEQVQLYIKQRIYHPRINVTGVIITNERLILRHPHALGLKKDYTDFNYRDVANVILDKGILRSTVKLTLRFGGDPLSLNDLPNSEAEKAYSLIRQNLGPAQGFPGVPFQQQPYYPPPQQQPQYSQPQVQSPTCPKCGSPYSIGQKYCPNCGNKL